MNKLEQSQYDRLDRQAKGLLKVADRHPEIAMKLSEIFTALDNIIGGLDSENINPHLVASQLSAASILLEGVQTQGRQVGEIAETEPGISLVDTIAQSVQSRVRRTRKK